MKLSIITINLNNSRGLHKTIESVVNQKYSDYEYIVVDGGSDDGSVELINNYSSQISCWVSEPDNGIYQAMNKGIKKAKGEYCLFLNSGDWLVSSLSLENFMAQVKDEDIITVHYGDEMYDGIIPSRGFSFYLFYKVCFNHFNTVVRRDLFDRVGLYDENFRIAADWAFFLLAIFKNNCSVKVIKCEFAKNEFPGISLTQMDLHNIERKTFLEVHFPYLIDDYAELRRLKQSRFIRLYDRLISNKLLLRIYLGMQNCLKK